MIKNIYWLDNKLKHKAWWRKWRGLPEPQSLAIAMITQEALKILNDNLSLSVNTNYKEFPEGETIKFRKPKIYNEKNL